MAAIRYPADAAHPLPSLSFRSPPAPPPGFDSVDQDAPLHHAVHTDSVRRVRAGGIGSVVASCSATRQASLSSERMMRTLKPLSSKGRERHWYLDAYEACDVY
jgi:hypothetical protein